MAFTTYQQVRNRRNFRVMIIAKMDDSELLAEIDYFAGWVRLINQGHPTVYRKGEMLARLRALHNEAVKRGLTVAWDRTTGMRIR